MGKRRGLTEQDLRALAAAGNPTAAAALAAYEREIEAEKPKEKPKRSKYRNQSERIGPLFFPSKLEADFYRLQKARNDNAADPFLVFTQVTWVSPSGNRLVFDFLALDRVAGQDMAYVMDAKGKVMADWEAKRREFEHHTGRQVILLKRGDRLPWEKKQK